MRLLGNEIYKLFKMKKIYLFLGLLCAMTLLTVYVFHNGREMGWHTVLENGNVHALLMANTTGLGQFFGIFIAVFVAGTIAEEYKSGTLKLSLTRPINRAQFLRSKIVAIFIFNAYLLTLYILSTYVIGIIAFGWSDSFVLNGINYSAAEGVLMALSYYGLYLVPFTALGILATFIAIVSRDVTMTIMATAAIPLAGQFFYRLESIRDFFLPMQMYFFPENILNSSGMSEVILNFVINLVYMTVFYLLSMRAFRKQDIII